MTNQRVIFNPVELEICADELVKELVFLKISDGNILINMPMVYPGGTVVALKLLSLSDGLCISDNGYAFHEACLMSIDHKYHDIASKVAKNYGINGVDGEIFLNGLTQEELASSTIWVATASVKTVEALLNGEREGD